MSLRRFPLYIFDLDGTLFRGETPVPGAVEALDILRKAGSKIRFLTNNSGMTRDAYVQKLRRLGFEAEPSEVYSSAIGSVARLQKAGVRRVFVVGEPGLSQSLEEAGFEIVGEGAEAVIVGICKSFSYDLMNRALQCLLAGAQFFATNTDATYPMEGGRLIPGAGSLVAAVQTCAGRPPEIIGKPEPFLVELVLREAGILASEALVVGDRYETDIVAGQRAGCETLLVMTGVATKIPPGQASLPSVAHLG